MKLLDRAIIRVGAQAFCIGPRVRCRERVSRIIDEKSIWDFLLLKSSRARIVRREAPSGRSVGAMLPIRAEDVRRRAMLRGRAPIAWITKSSVLHTIARTTAEGDLAGRIRDFLGLAHYQADDQLFEIVYPRGALTGQDVAAPTILDGGSSPVYRSCSHPDTWGRANDLRARRLGGPEAVHRPIRFTAGFKLRYLGPVKKQHDPSHRALERRDSRRRTRHDMSHLRACIVIRSSRK
ncbi:MAG TPA: hypothetical protein VGQ36_06080 [Thermoanaerobaculia bacterium]|jgi:hypothetical protein|nr:hypothetical protein [Thermoanaerobaculia bacterium]